jgi:hypothetical protein
MPIRPENRDRYPPDWKQISRRIRHERAENRCECTGQCGDEHDGGRCSAPNGEMIWRAKKGPEWTASARPNIAGWIENFKYQPTKIVLTVAHLDHTPENCDDENLVAMCQYCHNHYDADHRRETRRRTRDGRSGQGSLF